MTHVKALILNSGPAMTDSVSFQDKIKFLSKIVTGDMITPVMDSRHLNVNQIGDIRINSFVFWQGTNLFSSILRNVYTLLSTFIKVVRLTYGGNKYDIIISPNPLLTGLEAVLFARLLRAKAIIEINGNFESAFKYGLAGEIKPGISGFVKDKISNHLISWVIRNADAIKLVYKDQLKPLKAINYDHLKKYIFPNFVAINKFIEKEIEDAHYILLLGFPWYLKGVDVLIKAFNKISHKFPEYRLKIVGWCPEGRDYFENLAKDNSRIDLCDPVYYDEVISLMTKCSLYVLASRTDSSPRVLREAMASRKPIIASNIDGVPDLIKDGYNGLLFEKENVDDLAEKMAMLLSDKDLANRIAENGLRYVQEYFSEQCYLDNYKRMLYECLNN